MFDRTGNTGNKMHHGNQQDFGKGFQNARPVDEAEETRCDNALRFGLHALPTPKLADDFEARIQAALMDSPPGWQLRLATCWNTLRPALTPALCTMIATLLLVQWSQQNMIGFQGGSIQANRQAYLPTLSQKGWIEEAHRERTRESGEDVLEGIDLNAASLSFLRHAYRKTGDKRG